ncbi:MAG: magnesium-dependent phosphatase-1 [Bacteroidales bacterium]|nr:magnesium-dependent phosphatase-1 [Bacteroidales bacterium]
MLIVFDLDFTLWDCGGTYCDHTLQPYRKSANFVIDAAGREIKLYPEVKYILQALQERGFKMAIASRTTSKAQAKELLSLLEIDHHFFNL